MDRDALAESRRRLTLLPAPAFAAGTGEDTPEPAAKPSTLLGFRDTCAAMMFAASGFFPRRRLPFSAGWSRKNRNFSAEIRWFSLEKASGLCYIFCVWRRASAACPKGKAIPAFRVLYRYFVKMEETDEKAYFRIPAGHSYGIQPAACQRIGSECNSENY